MTVSSNGSRVRTALAAGFIFAAGASACASEDASERDEPLTAEPGAELLGGDTTVFDVGPNAFARPAKNLSLDARRTFSLGDHLFNRNWVSAPASTMEDGLGPTFNATSCSSCHLHDGRGAPLDTRGEVSIALLFRLSVPGTDAHGGPAPEPTYGGQLNPLAIPGVPKEGTAHVAYEEIPGTYADGVGYSLRRPTYTFDQLGYGAFAPGTLISPRVAPQNYGLGLLEAIPEATIRALGDPEDANHDGISGRPNEVWNERLHGTTLGRFGWKANQPSLFQQTAGAFLGDLGVSSSLFPGQNCPAPQKECAAAPLGGHGAAFDLRDTTLDPIVHYGTTLAVPARRNVADAQSLRGERLFANAGCGGCHTPKLVTGSLPGFPALENQTIRPYTDLRLHDMGEALADGRPDFAASGTEWRTPPLWGIGLIQTVNGHDTLLHDGRARGFAEAILWHGGEAERSKEAFRTMPAEDRAALVRFLQDL